MYNLLTSYSIIERNSLEIEHPSLRTFGQLSIHFNRDEKEQIRKAFQTPKKLKYKYWLMWLNIAIDRMEQEEFKAYIRKVDLLNVSKATN